VHYYPFSGKDPEIFTTGVAKFRPMVALMHIPDGVWQFTCFPEGSGIKYGHDFQYFLKKFYQ
jgi:hypothetical protein